jgi:hypothetical protein
MVESFLEGRIQFSLKKELKIKKKKKKGFGEGFLEEHGMFFALLLLGRQLQFLEFLRGTVEQIEQKTT